MACCIFKNCFNRPTPFSKVTFFNVPKDSRRQLWLERSGNEQVQNLPLTSRRVVCEAHFEEHHLRRQFHRTTLSRDAVPISHETVFHLVQEESPPVSERTGEQVASRLCQEKTEADVREVPNGSVKEHEWVEDHLSEDETELLEIEYMEETENTSQEVYQVQDESKAELLFETTATQTDTPETATKQTATQDVLESPPCKKHKPNESVKLTTDRATNTDEIPIKQERVQSPPVEDVIQTTEQSTQTEAREVQPPAEVKQKTEEEYFLLSLAEPLQRLPPEKRAMAKVKMLTYLVQLGCGMDNAQL